MGSTLSGERDLVMSHEGPYLLELSDGRVWDFRTTQGTPKSGVYRVANASARGLSSGEEMGLEEDD
jgi:hypothetical protein